MPAHSTATRGSLELQDGTSDAEGVVTFAVPAGHVQVTVNQILDAPIELDIPANVVTERVIDLPVRIEADVLVVDAAGRAVADARIVGRADFYLGARDEVELGRTGVDGHWRAPFVERSVLVRALVDGLASSPGVLLLPSKGTTELRLGGPAATLSGVVLDQDGRPVGGAHLAIRPQAKKWDGSVPIMVLAEKSGRFECAHVPPGPCTVTAWFALVPGQNRLRWQLRKRLQTQYLTLKCDLDEARASWQRCIALRARRGRASPIPQCQSCESVRESTWCGKLGPMHGARARSMASCPASTN